MPRAARAPASAGPAIASTLTSQRTPHAMDRYRFVLAIVLAARRADRGRLGHFQKEGLPFTREVLAHRGQEQAQRCRAIAHDV